MIISKLYRRVSFKTSARARESVVACATRVDASFSKSKLMRLTKAELTAACQENGLVPQGTKSDLSDMLLDRFEREGCNGNEQDRFSVTFNQSAALDRPATVTSVIQDLTTKIAKLDNDIVSKTSQLQELQQSDRAQMDDVAAQLREVKDKWQAELSNVSQGIKDAAALQSTHVELLQLQQQQSELQETVQGLLRTLKQRDNEIGSLQRQLKEVRTEQAEEQAAQATERLAVLALASHMAAASTATADASPATATNPYPPASMPVSTSATAGRTADAAAAPSAAVVALQKAMALPSAEGFQAQVENTRTFGMSLPALVALALAQRTLQVYTRARNALASTPNQRLLTDSASLLLGAVMASVIAA